MMLVDPEATIAALPSPIPAETDTPPKVLALIGELLSAHGKLSSEEENRLRQIAQMLGVDEEVKPRPTVTALRSPETSGRLKAS